MQPIQLENGIANIDINVNAVVPSAEGFGIIHEIQHPVTGDWVPLAEGETTALVGLPAMLPYRIVFLGTTEMMPGVGVGANSRLYTWRPRADFTHISEVRDMPGAGTINTVEVRLRLEGWLGGPDHTCTVKIRTGSGFSVIETADAVTDEQAPDDENAIYRNCLFTLGSVQGEYQIEIEGTTDNVVECFHVAQRIDVAYTV
jgi:hypothetical protein